MHANAFLILLLTAISSGAQAQAAAASAGRPAYADAPVYRVSFERRDAIAGISASGAIELPFECTTDGTVFVSFVSTVPAGVGLPAPPPVPPPLRLVSFSPAGKGQTYDLGQIPELYISREIDHYVGDSEVVFLVSAAREYKPEKRTYPMRGGGRGEFSTNAAEQHRYIVVFGRDGTYQRTTQIEDTFHIQNLGVFPSGKFLALGYDVNNKSPTLAMLNEDGTLLMPLSIHKGDMPESMVGKAGGPLPGVMAEAQLLPEGRSILMVQGDRTFPLLEVTEGGSIKAIHPELPNGSRIKALIPSDQNLYAIVRPPDADSASEGAIYELGWDDGKVLGRFELGDGRTPSDIACVHDQKFVSLDYGDGKVLPVIGSAEPANTRDQQERGAKE